MFEQWSQVWVENRWFLTVIAVNQGLLDRLQETLEVIKAQQSVPGGRHASIGYISGRMNASVFESVLRRPQQND